MDSLRQKILVEHDVNTTQFVKLITTLVNDGDVDVYFGDGEVKIGETN